MKSFRRGAALIGILCLLCAVFSVSAFADYDRFSATEYYFTDSEDYWGDCVEYSVSLDFDALEARINSYSSDFYDVVIPEYFEYGGERYTVTEIAGGDKYNQWQGSAEIPSTVTVIAPESVGYYLGEVEIDNSYWDEYGDYVYEYDYEYRMLPAYGFTIRCEEGSAAEKYAEDNGFYCHILKNIGVAEVCFSESEFVYTGWEIEPQVTVMIDEIALSPRYDYELSFDSNINAGTALMTVKGIGDYKGVLEVEFEILPADVSLLSFGEIPAQTYTGESIRPYFDVTYGYEYLKVNKDYSVSYSGNTDPGTAEIILDFEGNYTGQKVLEFKIELAPIGYFTAEASAESVSLKWGDVCCDEYRLYVYDSSKKKYVTVKKTTDNTYTHKKRKQLTTYKYAVKAIVYGDRGTYKTETLYFTVTTKPTTPTLSLSTGNKKVTVKWSKNSKVDGYVVYRMTNWEYEYTKVKSIKNKDTGSWTNKGLSNDNDYFYVVRSYKKVNGKYIYSDYSEQKFSGSSQSRLNAATLKSRKSFKVYNCQGKKSTLAWTQTLSDNDIKILKKFAKKHFTEDMSREEVLRITLDWINRNVTYASGDLWNEISGKSYVEAIFTYKKGQCVQYNGAMAAMMTYLGYEVELIQGYRYSSTTGAKWQHFWVEAEIAGNTYVFETGNYGKDKSWSYLCKKYSETFGYMKNGKKM